jgi:hypothetical protein
LKFLRINPRKIEHRIFRSLVPSDWYYTTTARLMPQKTASL